MRAAIDADPERVRLGTWTVVHAIADHIVDDYLAVTTLMANDIDTIEQQIFTPTSTVDVERIYFLKREVVEFRRAVAPLSVALQHIVSEHQDLIGCKEMRRYLRDVIDHQSTAADRITSYDDVLNLLVQAAAARVGMQQSIDLRKISAWVAIASVITMVAGIYGMNFEHMPELSQEWGYPAVLTVMVGLSTTLYLTFRRIHWL